MIYYRYLFLLVLFLSSCAKPIKDDKDIPIWVSNPKSLSSFQAVGVAKVNFQGIYMQRLEAITKARANLSEKISSYIVYEYKRRVKAGTNIIKTYDHSIVQTISNTILSNSYQADAYIDNDKNLYILLEIKSSPTLQKILRDNLAVNDVIKPLETYKFDKKKLLQSRCYSKNILEHIDTKYPMYKDKPIWFYRPDMDGIASVGISELYNDSTFDSQYKTSLALAKASLSKRKYLRINSIYKLSTIFIQDRRSQEDIHTIDTKSKTVLNGIILKDLWLDPDSCELYTWIQEK